MTYAHVGKNVQRFSGNLAVALVVFADVGVPMLAILNAVRVQNLRFK